jgi:Uma2 family endonuclease
MSPEASSEAGLAAVAPEKPTPWAWCDPISVHDPVRIRRFTIDEFERMSEAGVLAQVGRAELIEGLIFPVGGGDGPLRFTNQQYHRLAEIGLLGPKERVELIEGVIYSMSPIGSRHGGTLDFLSDELKFALRGRAVVRVQNSILFSLGSEPEPDIAVVQYRADYYRHELPRPQHVLLVVEIMESSATYDRGVKLPSFAREGIPEVWLADLRADRFDVHRKPLNGVYTESFARHRGQTLSPEAFPDVVLSVDAILG